MKKHKKPPKTRQYVYPPQLADCSLDSIEFYRRVGANKSYQYFTRIMDSSFGETYCNLEESYCTLSQEVATKPLKLERVEYYEVPERTRNQLIQVHADAKVVD